MAVYDALGQKLLKNLMIKKKIKCVVKFRESAIQSIYHLSLLMVLVCKKSESTVKVFLDKMSLLFRF